MHQGGAYSRKVKFQTQIRNILFLFTLQKIFQQFLPKYSNFNIMETTDPVSERKMTVADWMLTLLLAAIPVVNLVMLSVWAFGSSRQNPRKAWAKASLLWLITALCITLILLLVFGTAIREMMQSAPDFIETPGY